MSELGGTGFPTLMFLDEEGRKMKVHRASRSIKDFNMSLKMASDFKDLMEKAEAGDAKAATEVLILQLRRGWFDFDEAQRRVGELEKVSSQQRRTLDGLLVEVEVQSRAKEAGRDAGKRRAAGRHFQTMWKEGRVPADEARAYEFWSLMAEHAEADRDKKLFKKIVGEAETALKGNRRYARYLKSLEDRLKNFPRR